MRLPLLTRLEQQRHPVLHPAWAPRPVRQAAISDLMEQREQRRARRPLHRPPPATRAVLAAPAAAAAALQAHTVPISARRAKPRTAIAARKHRPAVFALRDKPKKATAKLKLNKASLYSVGF